MFAFLYISPIFSFYLFVSSRKIQIGKVNGLTGNLFRPFFPLNFVGTTPTIKLMDQIVVSEPKRQQLLKFMDFSFLA